LIVFNPFISSIRCTGLLCTSLKRETLYNVIESYSPLQKQSVGVAKAGRHGLGYQGDGGQAGGEISVYIEFIGARLPAPYK